MSNKIYVGNLPWSMRDEDLSELFSQIGEVVSARVIMDRVNDRSKGFGFVEFSTAEQATAAIDQFNGTEVDGRELRVNEAQEKPRD